MEEFKTRGKQLRADAKTLVYQFMQASDGCQPGREGMRQTFIFKECGFGWGDDYKSATSSQQQFWVVALLRELAVEGKVERVFESGPWRLL
ncbi:MAG: hypothetical protein ABIR13_02920 [Polaromonas sp.]